MTSGLILLKLAMKTIIAGSRGCTDYSILETAIELCPFEVTSVVSGKAPGADTLGEQYAINHNLKLHEYPAMWKMHGKSAGFVRNKQMAENAEALIALWDGISKGTANMIKHARKFKLQVFIYEYNKEKDIWGL